MSWQTAKLLKDVHLVKTQISLTSVQSDQSLCYPHEEATQ